ncbi:tetratricopeptide repeat protein [Methanofollis formosanus]|uniref:Tetratricopeptide repeat protein n=1 Tax=Methanofollis formosanus TaxID=299308 RepID=A0A8G1A2K2_9EURY|nr:tetratricopeptide repeat protein [Methanofollis formosanus]QYZ80209.1 tetratricopeptide repeat protein [Methanofollis formosanus]
MTPRSLPIALCMIFALLLLSAGCLAGTGGPDLESLSQVRESLNRTQEEYDAQVASEPENATAWCVRALVYLNNNGQNEEAMKSCDQALALDPEYGMAWYVKGVALVNLQRYDEAEACFLNASRCDPELADNAAGMIRRYCGD